MSEDPKLWRRPTRRIRLGDAIESVAKPIAKVIDKLAGTKIEGCQACAKRRDAMNRLTEKPKGILDYQ